MSTAAYHDFKECLKFSHECEDNPIWEEVYRQVFPDFSAMVSHRQDGAHQRAGIDRTVVLSNSKTIRIEEKARSREYSGDFLIEIAHRYTNGSWEKGWGLKPLACDYIAQAYMPSGIAIVIPFLPLQKAVDENWREWRETYHRGKCLESPNHNYKTHSIAPPVEVIFRSICSGFTAYFLP